MAIVCPGCKRTITKDVPNCLMCGATLHPENADGGQPAPSGTEPGPGTEPPTQELQFAGFWRRFFAFAIDSSVVSMIQLPFLWVWKGTLTGIVAGAASAFVDSASAISLMIVTVVSFIVVLGGLGLIYYSFFECSTFRATPGKLLMQAYVGDRTGAAVSFGHSLVRNLSKFFSTLIFGLGYLFPVFSERKQALHDMVAGTLILKKPDASTPRFIAGIFLALVLSLVAQRLSEQAGVAQKDFAHFKTMKGEVFERRSDYETPSFPPPGDEGVEGLGSQSSMEMAPSETVTIHEVTIDGNSYSLPHQVAFLRRNGAEIIISLFLNPPDSASSERLKAATDNTEVSELPGDMLISLRFANGNRTCNPSALSSYLIAFRASSDGLALPDSRESIEFSRAITNERSREGISLECERKIGGKLAALLKGDGGKVVNQTGSQYSWVMMINTTLFEAN